MSLQNKLDILNSKIYSTFQSSANNLNIQSSYNGQLRERVEELKSHFSGNLNIVVKDVYDNGKLRPPFTIVGAKEINIYRFENGDLGEISKAFVGIKNIILGLKLKIQESNNIFNIQSNHTVTVYMPEKLIMSDNFEMKEHVSVVLHEIGHWDTTGAYFAFLKMLSGFIGFFLLLYGGLSSISNLFSFNNPNEYDNENIRNNIKKENEEVKKSLYKSLIILLIGIFLYFIMKNVFLSFAEDIADSYSKKYGYGEEFASFLSKAHRGKTPNPDWELNNFTDIFEELRSRISTGYPSFNWRSYTLLESQQYVIENETLSKLERFISNNILELIVNKLYKPIMRLKPVNNSTFLIKEQSTILNTIDAMIQEVS